MLRFDEGLRRFVKGDYEFEGQPLFEASQTQERVLTGDEASQLGLEPLDGTPLWLLEPDRPPCRLIDRDYVIPDDPTRARGVYATLDGACELTRDVGFVVRAAEEPITCRLSVVDMDDGGETGSTAALPGVLVPLVGRDVCTQPRCVVEWRIRRASYEQVHLLSYSMQERFELDPGAEHECDDEYGIDGSGVYLTTDPDEHFSGPPILEYRDYRYVLFALDHRGLRAVAVSDLEWEYALYSVVSGRDPGQWPEHGYAWNWRMGDEPRPDCFSCNCLP